MKLLIALSALIACGLAAEEAKVIASPLAYAGYPYAGYPYAGYGYAGYPYSYASAPVAAAAPVAVAAPLAAAAPVAAYAPYAPYSAGSQFHAQDEFGNLNYGYSNLNSAKQEVGNTYGGVNGGYSYVDANGKLQQVTYVADAAGFRVADSRLPVAPVYDGVAPTFNPEPLVAPTFNPELPIAPEDTAEVAAAKAEHLAAVEAAKAGKEKREADPAFAYGFASGYPTPYTALPAGVTYSAGLPYNYGYAGLYGYGLPYLG